MAASVSETQLPVHSCLPEGQVWSHGWDAPTQAPPQTCIPVGQALPHLEPSQVALPPIGAEHGVHEVPQVASSLSLAQASPHR